MHGVRLHGKHERSVLVETGKAECFSSSAKHNTQQYTIPHTTQHNTVQHNTTKKPHLKQHNKTKHKNANTTHIEATYNILWLDMMQEHGLS